MDKFKIVRTGRTWSIVDTTNAVKGQTIGRVVEGGFFSRDAAWTALVNLRGGETE